MNRRGFTLVGAMAAALVLAILATLLGKNIFYGIRSRLRTEAKVGIVDNETTLAELIAAKLFQIINSNYNNPKSPCNHVNFVSDFNTNPAFFPGGPVTLKIENPTQIEFGLENTPAVFQKNLKTAITGCSSKPKLPREDRNWIGTYLFCVKINNPVAESDRKSQTGFLDSQAAFVEVRADLTSNDVSQEQKLLGDASRCSDWPKGTSGNDEKRQIKLSYRIFWKRKNDDSERGYLSQMATKIININELRTSE